MFRLASVAATLALASTAGATVPADLCAGNPCTVSGAKTVDAGSALDFGATTDLVLSASTILSVGPGAGIRDVTITARSITLQPGARILGNGDLAMVMLIATGGDLRLQSVGATRSRIDLRGNQAGAVFLSATGSVEANGQIDTSGSGTDSQGGDIGIDAGGSVSVGQTLSSGAAGTFSGGGEIAIFAVGDVVVTATLDTSAADFGGGAVTVSSDTGHLTLGGQITASGGGADGSGGSIDLSATEGNLVISANITGMAGSGIEEACGDGSEVLLTAGQSITLGAAINVNAGTQCFGGEVSASAGLDFIQLASGSIAARGPGPFGGGGSFILGAGRHATLRGIDLTSPGFGGTVDVVATGNLDVLGVLDAEATGSEGIGGSISLQACNITVASTGFLDARGAFMFPGSGQNRLLAGGLVTIAGQARAASGNVIQHRGLVPALGGTIVPPAGVSVNPDLPDCVMLAVCGNDVLDEGEACDDGNNLSCDGCNADCTRIDAVCGDARRECSEQCDDGNTADGDGCDADCSLPPTAGALLPGVTLPTAGCLAEWKLALADPAINTNTQLPSNTQVCTDGDPGCDTDATRDGVCTFGTQLCLRVPDERIPACLPAAIELVNIKQPQLPGGSNPLDQHNAQQLASGLMGLGGTVKSGNPILQSGPPITGSNVCTENIAFKVAHAPSGLGKRAFNILAQDVGGLTMSSNLVRLWCAPNTTVCGNGQLEVTEQCDDGNTASCDGCNASCRLEVCGNGLLECGEQCDDGPLNGTPESRCTATCTERPPDLRIPGGGAKPTDCAFEWSAELGTVNADRKGIPKNNQECQDNDPACDFDPAVGSCRFRLWGCLGAEDARIGCSATQVSRADVKAPRANSRRAEDVAARDAFVASLQEILFPVGPGELCNGFEIDVPAGNRRIALRVQALLASGKKDIDPLRLKCKP